MKNIDYLNVFFKKHKLSGKIKVKYLKSQVDDDYMSEITFENGDVVNINDIIFDIESDLSPDVYEQWLVSKRKDNIKLSDWMQSDNHYMPKIDTSSVEEYQKEMEEIVENVKKSIDKVFSMEVDELEKDEN